MAAAGNIAGAAQVSPADMGAIALSKAIGSLVADAGTDEFVIERPSGAKVLFVQANQGDWRLRPGDYVSRTVTAFDFTGGADEDILTITAHGFVTGDGPFRFTLAAGDALATGLLVNTDYWVIAADTNSNLDANTIQLATSLADAQAGTRAEFTDDGTFSTLIALGGSANGATSGIGWGNALIPIDTDEAEMGASYGAMRLGQGATAILSAPEKLTLRAYATADSVSYWFV